MDGELEEAAEIAREGSFEGRFVDSWGGRRVEGVYYCLLQLVPLHDLGYGYKGKSLKGDVP